MTAVTAFWGANKLRHESRRDSIDFEMIRASQRRRIRYIREIAELVVVGRLKVHRALKSGLLESTYGLPREWRPPWDQRRREAHGQSVMNGLVVFLGALGGESPLVNRPWSNRQFRPLTLRSSNEVRAVAWKRGDMR